MSSPRSAKRARHKERRAALRDAYRSEVARVRRRRRSILGVVALVLIAGAALAYNAFIKSDAKPVATPEPTPAFLGAPTPKPAACGADLPPTAGSIKKNYAKPVDQKLDPDKRYIWRLETSCGRIDVELSQKEDPITTNSVVFLTRQHYYDGLVFHRNLKDFVIQGGDPKGNGSGGPGYTVVEAPSSKTKYLEGVVAMAKGGNDPPGTSGSQFFIVTGSGAETSLTPDYAVLGKVVAGQDIVDKIIACCEGEPGPKPPNQWAYIARATVIEE